MTPTEVLRALREWQSTDSGLPGVVAEDHIRNVLPELLDVVEKTGDPLPVRVAAFDALAAAVEREVNHDSE